MKRAIALVLLAGLLVGHCAYAAKLTATWVNPTQNTDGSPLTDLVSITIQWGSCSSGNSAIATVQSSITVRAPATSAPIYTTGLTQVCAWAWATNSAGASSSPSNIASATVVQQLGKPIQLSWARPKVVPTHSPGDHRASS